MKRMLVLFAALLLPLLLMGQNDKVLRVGIDASLDCFLPGSPSVTPSFGIGVRARVGRPDQWLNLLGGVRYIYGTRLSGIQVPLLLNLNLIKGRQVSAYLGGGYEFDFIGTYWGAAKFQIGLAGSHCDFRLFYKPYQADLGAGFTYYF